VENLVVGFEIMCPKPKPKKGFSTLAYVAFVLSIKLARDETLLFNLLLV